MLDTLEKEVAMHITDENLDAIREDPFAVLKIAAVHRPMMKY